MSIDELKKTLSDSSFASIDLLFADYILRASGDSKSEILFLSAALASYAVNYGDSCCDLTALCGTDLAQSMENLFPAREPGAVGENKDSIPEIRMPEYAEVCSDLKKYPETVAVLPEDVKVRPLILDERGRLYLSRYYFYEKELAERIVEHLREPGTDIVFDPGISNRFALFDTSSGEPDWQCFAAELSLRNNLVIITGGPGTGKTTVAAALLASELVRNPNLSFSLCAPTGKAQVRLREAIRGEIKGLNVPQEIAARLQDPPCSTIDRMLGANPVSPVFMYNAQKKLPSDLVLVDEASMVSVAKMSKLFAAIRPESKIILLGDRNQLSSVEAGAVLGDLCNCAVMNQKEPGPLPLTGHVAELKLNYRSKSAPVICGISAEMRDLKAEDADVLTDRIMELSCEDFITRDICTEKALAANLPVNLPFRAIPGLVKENTPEAFDAVWKIVDDFKILCAVRDGVFGVESINQRIRNILNMNDLEPIAGLPVMILKNDPATGLFNGDIGVIWNKENGQLQALFPPADDSPVTFGNFRSFLISELPPWEDAFAMTIHKSQGSGFDTVQILMPDKTVPILTMELIYTAITRAKKKVLLWTSREILKIALSTRTRRSSGLADRINSFFKP